MGHPVGPLQEVFPEPNSSWPEANPYRAYEIRIIRVKTMSNILVVLAVIGVWVLLQLYILPKFGIST